MPDTNCVGLFSYVKGGNIRNLGIEIAESKEIKGRYNIGGIAGYVGDENDDKPAIIINSYVIGNVNGNAVVGGIAGTIYTSSLTNSYSTGSISSSGGGTVGGIAGNIGKSSITNSYSTGSISGGYAIGGIAGNLYEVNITNSYSTGDINGGYYVGGIAGEIGESIITNSYSTGDINGGDYAIGGIAGLIDGGSITNSYSTGSISGDSNVSGIAGVVIFYSKEIATITNNAAINPSVSGTTDANRITGSYDGSIHMISNNFALNTMSGTFTNAGNEDFHGIDKTIDQLKTKSTYEADLGWSFGDNDTNPWNWEENKNGGLPYLYWQEL